MATADFPKTPELIEIPPSAYTLEGFTEWTYSDDFPEQGRITFADGRILIDMSPERYELHVKPKDALTKILGTIVEEEDLGEYYGDGGRIQNHRGSISNEPDAIFATWETLESGKLAPPTDKDGRHIDMVGTPDWVCEVLSDASVNKDTRVLWSAYHQAGIPEYWLIDARGEEIDFQLLVWHPNSYVAAEDQGGWKFSPVFNRHFQLTREHNRIGRWRYLLKTR